jgi:membrane protein DedA with SNARE-associated domain
MSLETLGWYASIFFWLFFTGIGIPPCPEEAGIIYAAGVTALHPEVRWWLAWPLTGAGIVCADMALYGIGRHFGRRLFDFRWVQRIIKDERRQRLEARFNQHGIKILLMARLLPPLRTGVFVIAGAIRYPFLRFLAADAAYAVVGVGIFFFGSTWLIDLIHQAGKGVLYVVAGLAVIYGLYRYYRYLRKRELKGTAQPPISVVELAAEPTPAAKEPEKVGAAAGSSGDSPRDAR